MKKRLAHKLIIIVALIFINLIQAQVENVVWATVTGGEASNKRSRETAIDDGNIYITGYFEDSIYFGDITLTSSSFYNIFLAKYDSLGNVVWAKSFKSGGGSSMDKGIGLETDTAGNVYLSGSFNGSGLVLGGITIVQEGDSSQFVAKMDSNGNAIWGKAIPSYSGNLAEDNNDIVIDSDGAVIMAGSYYGGCKINNVEIGSPGYGSYIVKYDSQGTLLWYRYPQDGSHTIRAVAVDSNDNIYFTGENTSAISLDSYNLAPGNVFTGKYNTSGDLVWLKQGVQNSPIGIGSLYSFDIKVDSDNDIAITGTFLGSISFSGNILTDILSPQTPPINNSFVVKYDNLGNVIWAKKTVPVPVSTINTLVYGTKIQFDNSNNTYICGYTNTEIKLDDIVLTHDGEEATTDIFIARYNTLGNVDWAKKVCKSRFFIDEPYADLIVENNENLIISGLCYDNTIIGDTTLNNGIFVAKIAAPALSNPEFDIDNSINIFPNPIKDQLNISSKNDISQLFIYNSLGQLVKSFSGINMLSYAVDLSELQAGYYFVEAVTENKRIQQKVIKL